LSHDISAYLGALETAISGNIIWSQVTERYGFFQPTRNGLGDDTPDTVTTPCGEKISGSHRRVSKANAGRYIIMYQLTKLR
jgi:hypothetical protein